LRHDVRSPGEQVGTTELRELGDERPKQNKVVLAVAVDIRDRGGERVLSWRRRVARFGRQPGRTAQVLGAAPRDGDNIGREVAGQGRVADRDRRA
jgi:hypothetical protein